MNRRETESRVVRALTRHFGERESMHIARLVADYLLEQDNAPDLEPIIQRLVSGEPVQYITGQAWFYKRLFAVNRHVLIPRPETEELVDWVVQDYRNAELAPTVLDIGTGSGCIAISLKLELPHAIVHALDKSHKSLQVARLNSLKNNVLVSLYETDILVSIPQVADKYDVIVSNPPYIDSGEYEELESTVRDHEPAMALVAPGTDPLIFYRRIADIGHELLNPGGTIYVELNPSYAGETRSIFERSGYSCTLRKDLQDKHRLLRGAL